MWSFFQHVRLSPRRQAFAMPLVWPAGGAACAAGRSADGRAWVRQTLDAMLSCPTGFDLILALMSDPYWYDANVKAAYKTAVDAAVAAEKAAHQASDKAAGTDQPLPALFFAATILAKQIVRHIYDLPSGQLLQDRVVMGLAMARTFSGLQPDATVADAAAKAEDAAQEPFEHFAGTIANQDDPWGPRTIDVWQALRCLVAFGALKAVFDAKWATRLEAAAAAEAAAEAADAAAKMASTAFMDSLGYHTDRLSHLIRCSMATTGAIQTLSTRMLEFYDAYEGPLDRPQRPTGRGLVRRLDHKNDLDTLWRNYYFDLGAMWSLANLFHLVMLSGEPSEMVHVASRARIWTIAGGFTDSVPSLLAALKKRLRAAAALGGLPPAGPGGRGKKRAAGAPTVGTAAHVGPLASAIGTLEDILHATTVLHGMYMRIWDAAMAFCNVKRYGRGNVERCMARISAAVMLAAPANVSVIQETPDCGLAGEPTAAVLMDNWPMTLLGPEQFGLVEPTSGVPLLGADLGDLKGAACSAHASRMVTQSDQHLWVSITKPEAWASMGRTLPQMDDISMKLLAWRPDWSPTLEDLKAVSEAHKKKYLANQKAEADMELASLVAAF
jgi:hypothetical protein